LIRRGFTLIELVVIIAIMGAMVTVGVVSFTAGRGAVRVKGATRDIFAAIRQARSVALVTQQPAIITYSVEEVDGETVARVVLTSAKLFSAPVDRSKIRTLRGDPLPGIKDADSAATNAVDGSSLVGDVLFAPIDDEVVKGMRLKVSMGDALEQMEGATRQSKISVFSTADYLLSRYKAKTTASAKAAEAKEDAKGAGGLDDQEPVSVVWETNGRVEPHRVWVYADGQRPEDGLSIRIDRFGAAKVLTGDGREEE